MEQNGERYLTAQEAADIAGVVPRTIHKWIKSGSLMGTLLGRKAGYRIQAAELHRFLNSQEAVDLAHEALRSKTFADSGALQPAA